jgi:hypothetical protein
MRNSFPSAALEGDNLQSSFGLASPHAEYRRRGAALIALFARLEFFLLARLQPVTQN